MICPDVQILVYAYDELSQFHAAARTYWSDCLSTYEPVGIPIQCLHGFLRIITNPALGRSRMPMQEALDIAEEWVQLPHVHILVPGTHHWILLKRLITDSQAFGGFVSDVVIAAIVMEHGAILHTTDRGFARIPGLRWENPLNT